MRRFSILFLVFSHFKKGLCENSWFYGDPVIGCKNEEVVVQFNGVPGEVCSPLCLPNDNCPNYPLPPDVPSQTQGECLFIPGGGSSCVLSCDVGDSSSCGSTPFVSCNQGYCLYAAHSLSSSTSPTPSMPTSVSQTTTPTPSISTSPTPTSTQTPSKSTSPSSASTVSSTKTTTTTLSPSPPPPPAQPNANSSSFSPLTTVSWCISALLLLALIGVLAHKSFLASQDKMPQRFAVGEGASLLDHQSLSFAANGGTRFESQGTVPQFAVQWSLSN